MAIDGIIILLLLVVLSFLSAFLDAAIGIGYGTFLTPLLILLNLPILEIIPAVLFAQIIAATVTAVSYYLLGNIQFTRTSTNTQAAIILSLAGILGATIAITMFYTIFFINPLLLQLYIAFVLLLTGFLVLIGFHWRFTRNRLFVIGTLAAINKGLSGGGYTPLVAGSLLLSGRNNKQAIGATNVAKAVTSLTALLLYLLLGHLIFDPAFLHLAMPLALGTFIAAPLASYLIRRSKSHQITLLIGMTITLLGFFTLIKTLFIQLP